MNVSRRNFIKGFGGVIVAAGAGAGGAVALNNRDHQQKVSVPVTPNSASFVKNLMGVFHNPMDYGAEGGGANDTGPVQAALDACASGGIFLVPPTTLETSNLTVHGKTVFMGAGKSSVLRAIPGTTGNFISLSDPADSAVIMKDVVIDGNSQPGLTNIYYDNAGGLTGDIDTLHRFLNVYSCNAGVDAYHLGPAVIETNMISCYAYNSGRHGYNFDVGATDSRVIACTSGLSGSHGFLLQGNNDHFTDCKSYYSGFDRAANAWTPAVHGFMLCPSAGQDLHMVSLTACEAQNNSVDGFHVDGSALGAVCQHITIASCMADGNNEILGHGSGLYLNNVRFSVVNGFTARLQEPAAQKYGLSLAGNLAETYMGANDFNGSAGAIYIDQSASGFKFAS